MNRFVCAALFNCEFTKPLTTQFIRSNGIDCTKYSRCSVGIKHIGRFFCVISSSRSFSDCNSSGNHISSHEHTSGLSRMKFKFNMHFYGECSTASMIQYQTHKKQWYEYQWKLHLNHKCNRIGEKNLPTISTTRNVSMIGSITSSGIRDNLLFWMFNVSSEFRFSNDEAGNTDILKSNINIKIDWLKW